MFLANPSSQQVRYRNKLVVIDLVVIAVYMQHQYDTNFCDKDLRATTDWL